MEEGGAPAATAAPAPAPTGGGGTRRAAREERPLYPGVELGQLNVEDGLPQSQVNAIVQDRRGFVWFGTQEGLARWDGHHFVVFRPEEGVATSIAGAFVTSLAVSADGMLWVGLGDKGVARYDDAKNAFTNFAVDDGSADTAALVTGVHVDAKGTVLAASAGGGLLRFDAAANRFVPIEPPSDGVGPGARSTSTISAVASHPDGGVWAGTATGVFRTDASYGALTPLPIGDGKPVDVRALLHDADGTLWVGTATGLLAVDPKGGAIKARYVEGPGQLSREIVSALYQDRRGNLWVGTATGLNRLARGGKRFDQFVYADDDTHRTYPRNVLSLHEDQAGVLFVGTIGGVRIHDALREQFHPYRDAWITAVAADDKGTIWAVSYHSGLLRYDRAGGTVTTYRRVKLRGGGEVDLESYWLTAVFLDRDGTLWLSGEGSDLLAFDPRSETLERIVLERGEDLRTHRLDRIIQTQDGALWIATWGTGLVRLDPKTRQYEMITPDEGDAGIPSFHLYTLVQDKTSPSVLWLGTAERGLVRYEIGRGATKIFEHEEGNKATLSNSAVESIYQDKAGALWVGTYGGGLNRVDPASGAIKIWRTKDGLPNDTVYGILPDPSGQLWLSTNGGGLVRFDPESAKMEVFGVEDGLQDPEFVQNSYVLAPTGELVFGGPRGLNVFRPQDLVRDQTPPPVVLTGLKIRGQPVAGDVPPWNRESIELGYTDGIITFEFAALSFGSPDKNQFAYKLEGLHDDWISTSERSVTYNNLDGGDYVFRVKAANRHGVWNEAGFQFGLDVSPPPWRTWWAYSLYGLVVLGAVGGVLFYQRRRLQALERENRLAAVERDLELTGTIQSGFLPQENPVTTERTHLHGFYRPADFASGDWWWYERTGDSKHTIMVGDVTGHGSGPAMVTAALATAYRVQAGEHDMPTRLQKVNHEVFRSAHGRHQVTMSILELDDATGEFTFYSAGGLPLVRMLPDKPPKVVPCRGAALGQADFNLGTVKGKLEPGERLFLFTDGIPEQVLPNGRQLGLRKMLAILEKTRPLPATNAIQLVVTEVDTMRQKTSQDDDWTMTVFDWVPQARAS